MVVCTLAAHTGRTFLLTAAILVGIAGLVFVVAYFSRDAKLKRLLRATPVCPLAQLTAHDAGRVVGKARAYRETLDAPLTGRKCLYYEVIVNQKSGKHWHRILRETQGVEFLVDDGTGKALVDPNRAEVVVTIDGNSGSGTFDDADPAQEALLARHGHKSTGLMFNKTLRYTEAIIGVGEQVSALGRRAEASSASRGSAAGAAAGAVPLAGAANGKVVISDCRSTTTC